MTAESAMEFYCMTCKTGFDNRVVEVARAMERVHYYDEDRLPEVEVTQSEGIGIYCSVACRAMGLRRLMAIEQVPIPARRPGIEPVEVCARCSGPVDMSSYHLTYSESVVVFDGDCGQDTNFEYLAVLCKRCASAPAAFASLAQSTADLTA